MLCYKTDEKGQKVFGQISVDSKSIVDVGFFLNTFGDYMLRMYNGPCDPKNKFRIILDYDPEDEKSLITFTFDEQESRFEIPPTKEAAEQASQERVKDLGYGSIFNARQKYLSKKICERIQNMITQKVKLSEINELVRTLSHFEKTGTLPDSKVLNETANRFLDYVEVYLKSNWTLYGEPTMAIVDSVHCIHRLNDIMWKMRQEGSRNATD